MYKDLLKQFYHIKYIMLHKVLCVHSCDEICFKTFTVIATFLGGDTFHGLHKPTDNYLDILLHTKIPGIMQMHFAQIKDA